MAVYAKLLVSVGTAQHNAELCIARMIPAKAAVKHNGLATSIAGRSTLAVRRFQILSGSIRVMAMENAAPVSTHENVAAPISLRRQR
jgi:hypothetical protein